MSRRSNNNHQNNHLPRSSLLDASFDAGFLVKDEGRSGRILYANSAAHELYKRRSLVGSVLKSLVIFWSRSIANLEGAPESTPWKAVLQWASDPDQPVQEWAVSLCLHNTTNTKAELEEQSDFQPGILRLSSIDEDRSLWVVFVKPSQTNGINHHNNNHINRNKSNHSRSYSNDSTGDLSTLNSGTMSLSQAANQRAQQIVEVALDPMFQINQHGTILMVNRAACRCFRYKRRQLIGQNISIICGGEHGEHHDEYIQKYLQSGKSQVIGKPYRELPARRSDGSEFEIRLAVVELERAFDEETEGEDRLFCGFVHDLSAERRNEDIIFGTIDTSLDPVFQINEKGIIKNVNTAAIEHLGWSWEELLGQSVNKIVGGGHASHHDEYIQRYLETGQRRAIGKRRKVYCRRKDGSEMLVELQLSEIKLQGRGNERLFCAILVVLIDDGVEKGDVRPASPTPPKSRWN